MFQAQIQRETIRHLIERHEDWRRECINLTASENIMSPSVRRYLNTDLVQRYADYTGRELGARRYKGTRWIEQIERVVHQLASEVFRAKYVETRAISGHVAGTAVIMGLTRPGDTVLEISPDIGGHRLATKLALAPLINLDVRFIPYDPLTYDVELGKTFKLIDELQPRLVILGSSAFLFPHPVHEFSEALKKYPDTLLVYDASHVFGLIAARRFQDPLTEGATVVFGSTHKTLPGPQGGIILSNSDELMDQIVLQALYPAQITNHHVFRMPALAVCLLEMKEWGEQYADAVITNAQALGLGLESRGLSLVNRNGCYTQSHTLVVCTAAHGSAQDIALRLEEANIIVTTAHLPRELGGEGLRLGTQEIARLGATIADMEPLADLLTDVIVKRRSPEQVRPLAREYTHQFQECMFTWQGSDR